MQLWQAKASALHEQLATQGFNIVIALECEFYISHSLSDDECASIVQTLQQDPTITLIEEEGHRQFEYHLPPSASIESLVTAHHQFLKKCEALAGEQMLFATKPYADQPASGIHIHIHAEDTSGQRLYYKKDDEISSALEHSIAGLFANLEEAAAILMKDSLHLPLSLAGGAKGWRFPSNRYASNEDHIANTVSWGNNNRSCAIRLPDSDADQKRIEYRIAASDATLEKLLAIICASILDGVKRKLTLPPATFGNASDAQYNLRKLPANLEQAEDVLSREFRLRHRLA